MGKINCRQIQNYVELPTLFNNCKVTLSNGNGALLCWYAYLKDRSPYLRLEMFSHFTDFVSNDTKYSAKLYFRKPLRNSSRRFFNTNSKSESFEDVIPAKEEEEETCILVSSRVLHWKSISTDFLRS